MKDQRSFDPGLLIRKTSWTDVKEAALARAGRTGRDIPVVPYRRANYSGVVCCSKLEESDSIPWDQCAPRNVMSTNFTAIAALARARAPS